MNFLMKRIVYIVLACVCLCAAGCKKKVNHEAVRAGIVEQLSVQYDPSSIDEYFEIRPSDRSPLLYEVIDLQMGDTMLFSVDTKHSRVVDQLTDSHLMPFSITYPLYLSEEHSMRQLTNGSYSCTTDSTIRIVSDSLFLLDSDTLFHLQCTKLYTLKGLRFELAFDTENLIRDWDSDSRYYCNLTTDVGREYNARLATVAARILAGDSIGNLELEKLIPDTREKFDIYNLHEFTGDSIRFEQYVIYDSYIRNAAAGTYQLMDRYLNSYFFADGALAQTMIYYMHEMDSVNPLLFRQAACYTFDNSNASYISDAIREYQNDWYERLYDEPAE